MIDSRAFICSNRFSGTYANSVRKIIIVWFLFSHRKNVFVFSRSFYLLLNEKVFLIQYICCTETWFSRCSSQEFSVIQVSEYVDITKENLSIFLIMWLLSNQDLTGHQESFYMWEFPFSLVITCFFPWHFKKFVFRFWARARCRRSVE